MSQKKLEKYAYQNLSTFKPTEVNPSPDKYSSKNVKGKKEKQNEKGYLFYKFTWSFHFPFSLS